MATYTTTDGRVFDVLSGEEVGVEAGAPTGFSRRPGTTVDIDNKGFSQRAIRAIRQASWGMNTALMFLPQAAVSTALRGLGVPEDEVPKLAAYFNRGETAPENAVERYARAIGEGYGAGLGFTGVLGVAAKSGAMAAPLKADAGFFKRVAKETFDFIRKDPLKAAALDANISAGIEAGRQLVEEKYEGPAKGIVKEVAPVLPFLTPTGIALAGTAAMRRKGKARTAAETTAEADVVSSAREEALSDVSKLSRMTGIPSFLVRRAENKLQSLLGKIEESPEAMDALRRYNELVQTPEIRKSLEAAGLSDLDFAQQTMSPALIQAKEQALDQLSGDLLNRVIERQRAEGMVLPKAFELLRPDSSMDLQTALRGIADDAAESQSQILSRIEELTGEEVSRISASLDPKRSATVGSSLRNALNAASESSFLRYNKLAEQYGLREGFDRFGRPVNVRDADGRSLLPSFEIDDSINELNRIYQLNKGGPFRPQAPYLVNLLNSYRKSKQVKPEAVINQIGLDRANDATIRAIGSLPTVEGLVEAIQGGGRSASVLRFVEMVRKNPDIATPEAIPNTIRNPFFAITKIDQTDETFGAVLDAIRRSEKTDNFAGNLAKELRSIAGRKVVSGTDEEILQSVMSSLAEADTAFKKIASGKALNAKDLQMLQGAGYNTENIAREAYTRAFEKLQADVKVDINLPEAIQLLDEGTRYRNSMYTKANELFMADKISRDQARDMMSLADNFVNDLRGTLYKALPDTGIYQAFRDMYDQDFARRFETPIAKKIMAMAGPVDSSLARYVTPDEQIVRAAFSDTNATRDLVTMLEGVKGGDKLLRNAFVDWAFNPEVRGGGQLIDKTTGLIDPKRVRAFKAQNASVLESIPTNVRSILDDEILAGEAFAKRLGELEEMKTVVAQSDVFKVIKQTLREDATPDALIQSLTRDPANMRVVVDALSKDPERLAALRRSVYEFAEGGALSGGSLRTFLEKNRPSMAVLYGKDSTHLKNLEKLAELQERILSTRQVTGKIPAFEATSEWMQSVFGTSIPSIATTVKQAAVRQFSPEYGAMVLGLRFFSNMEGKIFQRLFDRAITDADFANAMVKRLPQSPTPANMAPVTKEAAKIGVYLPALVGRQVGARSITAQTEEQDIPRPGMEGRAPVSGTRARDMLRMLPPAPQTRGLPQGILPPAPQQGQPAGLQTRGMEEASAIRSAYPAMFPQDPLSSLIQIQNERMRAQQNPQNQ